MSAIIDIVLLVIVVAVFWRLWQVLGQRTGAEKPPQEPPILAAAASPPAPPSLPRPERKTWQGFASEGSDLAKGLEAIANEDLQFDTAQFLAGAKAAHETILDNFASGNTRALRPLLSPEVLKVFTDEIARRKASAEPQTEKFVGHDRVDLKSAAASAGFGRIGVHFLTRFATNNDTALKTDLWVFERRLNDTNPNWLVVETAEADGPP